MTPTAECRWWLPGPVPDGPVSWLRDVGGREERGRRVDHYLLLPARPGVGIKARAGESVEVKVRTRRGPVRQLAHGVRGRVERWRKWHFPVETTEPGVADLDVDPASWVAVHKRRWQVELAGCEVEIADVAIAGSAWHSLGLEARDIDHGGHRIVLGALDRLVASGVAQLLTLEPDACHGYPQQVLDVVAASGH